ncbi:MAG: sigma-70 family RNA polymerase sigma factor [Reichenbachiella sp.]
MKITPQTPLDQQQKMMDQFRSTGDLEVLGDLYKPYLHLVYGVCLKYLKNHEDAQDAVTNIFEELILKLPKHQVDNFKSWLHVLTKNHCLMLLRKNKSQGHSVDISSQVMESEEHLHLDDESALEDNLTKLESCIQKLKEEQRVCVQQFFLEKKCYQEIVDATGHDLKKVKSYIQNGKRNLKLCIESSE